MTQEQRVLDYIDKYGSITSLEAFQDLGITRLSAKIYNLKKDGYEVSDKTEKCKNRYGDDVTYKRYTVKKMTEDNMNHIPNIL
ncbi:MAG: helix-turn-helix domain-containing protein [Lachnospiraceae bacterium]|jgi:hypothetical protein|nr:helix-turn-helix domain-containing protein [Lachnospiraceae bacterium]